MREVHPFQKMLLEAELVAEEAPRRPPIGALPIPPEVTGARDRRYGLGALEGECANVAQTVTGRNDQLNQSAYKLAGYIASGALTEDEVRDGLTHAARIASGNGDHPLTDDEITKTINSALGAANAKGLVNATPEDDDDVVTEVAPGTIPGRRAEAATNGRHIDTAMGETEPKTEAELEAARQELHRIKVLTRAYDLRVADEGKILWAAQRAAMMGQTPPVPTSLTAMLAIADLPATYRIDDLWPMGGRVLLAAQYKSGKSTLVGNLLRALVDGDDFLGRWKPRSVSRVTLLDTELDEAMLRRWLRDQGIRHTDAIDVVSLRGKVGTFNILDDTTRAEWAERIGPTDVLVLDCLRPCLDALGLSEDKEAGRFLVAFDALCREAGAAEATMVHHMGHSQERSRGDSRLLDWPDVLWKIVRDTNDDDETIEGGDRFFSAMGRDVNVAEAQLDYTHETRSLMICGGGRADKKARGITSDIVEVMMAAPEGLGRNELVNKLKAFGAGRNVARLAVANAVQTGLLVIAEGGPGRPNVHQLNPSRRSQS